MKPFLELAGGWRRAAGVAFVAVAFAFLVWFLASNVRELKAQQWTLRPLPLLASLLLQMVGLASGALVWQRLLRGLGTELGFVPLARVRFVSGLARFTPGKIWPFLGAASLARSFDIPAATTIVSLLAHTVFSLIGAVLIAAICLPAAASAWHIHVGVLRFLAPLLLLLAHPRVMALTVRAVARVTRRQVGQWHASWSDGLYLIIWSAVGWILTGVALFIFLDSLTPLPRGALLPVVGMNALAFVLGQLFFIAPAGLGAKEGAVAALLALYVSAPVAALLAVAARVWMTLAEIALAFVLVRLERTGAEVA